ncbi:hypothetical protein BH11PLA2_BH11PLA2_11290 [soil metagenome]
MVRLGLAVILGLAAVAVAWNLRADVAPVPAAATPASKSSTAIGMSGCAAAACHGNPNAESLTNPLAKDIWKASFTHWTAVDPHQKAYAALKSPLAQQMSRLLKTGPAPEDVRCLACHTNPTLALKDPDNLRGEGVSCESCHGNASDWRASHTTWTPQSRAAGIAGTSFHDLKTDLQRATVCAGCHIGSPANGDVPVRDMNHDMIAAGHPRLDQKKFDTLMGSLRPHWKQPEFVTHTRNTLDAFADAQCELAIDRKKRSLTDKRTPWPEFADRVCADCHKPLK